jgi:hypothetical protein
MLWSLPHAACAMPAALQPVGIAADELPLLCIQTPWLLTSQASSRRCWQGWS